MGTKEAVAQAIYDGDWDWGGDATAKLFCEGAAERVLDLPEIREALITKRVLDQQPCDAEFSDIRFEIREAVGRAV